MTWVAGQGGLGRGVGGAAAVEGLTHDPAPPRTRYDGIPLWNVRGVPGVHAAVWVANYVSFFLLYPSTFNLLEARDGGGRGGRGGRGVRPSRTGPTHARARPPNLLNGLAPPPPLPPPSTSTFQVAAVDEPKVHLWETGVTRITRHPQAVGQGLWCAAHTAWVGSSFMLATSAVLMAHHLFSVWHGDYRLRRAHGPAFDAVAARTSAFPFQAIWEGRQVLPPDYWKEWARAPYLTIAAVTLGCYLVHPYMQAGAHALGL